MNSKPSVLRLAIGSASVRIGLLLVLFGLIFGSVALSTGRAELEFVQHARSASAAVLVRAIRRADTSDNNKTKYVLRYRFAPAAGNPGQCVPNGVVPGSPGLVPRVSG